jgi:hypothetical protein
MVGGAEKDTAGRARQEKAEEGSTESAELDELKHNLKVSFSRMKEDIHFNREQVEDLVKANRMLLEQVSSLKDEIKALKERPKGLKTELIRSLARNQKALIKQRILELVNQGRFSIPELKERIVDDRNYCSKASFYRYIEELKSGRKIDFLALEGREVVVAMQTGESTAIPELKKREDFV